MECLYLCLGAFSLGVGGGIYLYRRFLAKLIEKL